MGGYKDGMKEIGYITLWDIDCVFVVEDNCIVIIPKDKADAPQISSHWNNSNFIVQYNSIAESFTAFIERVESDIGRAIKLYPKYIAEFCHNELFSGFDITGEAIDDFFSPSRYFYDRQKRSLK